MTEGPLSERQKQRK